MLRLREIETEKSDKFYVKQAFGRKGRKPREAKRRVREKVVEINHLI